MSPQCSAEVLSGVPKHGEAVMCLKEKKHKLCSGMSYTAVDHEFNVNESTIYIK